MLKSKTTKYTLLPAFISVATAAGLFSLPPLPTATAQNLHRVAALRRQAATASDRKDFEVAPLETRVLGQRAWLRGGPASLRVIVSNHATGKSVPASVALFLIRLENGKAHGETLPLYAGRTNALGTLDAQFNAPKTAPGAYQLKIDVRSPLGSDTVTQAVQVQESMQLLLTADKPLYQPGQTVHLRALALDMATREALAERPVTFEVEDARGNKVFKEKQTLSRYGVASADFVLADEVNMGLYTLRAVLPTGETEKKVRVERYVLPKYKIAITTDKPYYLPGEQVKGTVKATYFFGKPVSDAQVSVEINTFDVGVTKLTEMKDKTDPIGVYNFRYTLPRSFVGQPFAQGKAQLEIHGTIKDKADHKQDARQTVPVVKDPISLVLVPESRTLVPGVENRVFIAAATPDGAPMKHATLDVTANWRDIRKPITGRLTTDDMGLATFAFTPMPPDGVNRRDAPNAPPDFAPVTVAVKATDAQNHTGTSAQQLTVNGTAGGLILRSDKTLARVGDRLNLAALSSMQGGTVYIDVIRNKQTILTRAETLHNGQAQITLPLTHDMAGTLQIRAYKILPDENIIRDTRTIIVSPADDLNVSVTADKTQYRPGGDAVLNFAVRDQKKNPVQAALGLAFVDESVFALSELQPGLEKIYFTLEKELMEPKYEIHGLKPSDLLQPGPVRFRLREQQKQQDVERQRAATLLLAAVPPQQDFEIRVNTFAERWAKVAAKAVLAMMETNRKMVNAAQKYRNDTKTSLTAEDGLERLVTKGYLRESDLRDPWGRAYKVDLQGQKNYDNDFTLSSAGPDGRWNTGDDLANVSLYGWNQPGRFRGGRFGGGGFAGRFGRGGGEDARALGAFDDAKMLAEQEVLREMPQRDNFAARARMAMPAGAAGPEGAVPLMMMRAVTKSASAQSAAGTSAGGGDAPRVRSYFPETMYWNPALITDGQGNAQLTVPLADSITTWRLSLFANSQKGQMGSATESLRVFQDFFVDIDLPVSLTQHDRVDVPVAVYNYMSTPQDVTLTLKQEPWFALAGKATQTLKVAANQVSVVYYPITANQIGRHALEITAKGSKLSDAMRRQIDVTPDGRMLETTLNDRLEGRAEKSVTFAPNALPGASSLWVKLYPGAFSQVVEGLDGVLRMPNGCFEQTSSTTYPNLLVLDYLKQTKKINPELQMKAEGYINIGYPRLVTFECKSGGFSWFGNEPAHQVLTAYGLLEFSDMARVHEVDLNVIARTQNWLASKQQPDGTWEEKGQGIAEGIINRQTGALRTTAYVAWALAESGYNGPQLQTGVAYVKAHLDEAKDPYTLAVILNLLTKQEKDSDATAKVANALIALAKTTDKDAYWQSDTQTFTGARERGADLETTGLAAYGLGKWGRNAGFTTKVLTHLVQSKDSSGTWDSTQGTVWSMKALLYASRNGTGGKGTVTILANGKKAGAFRITPDDSDVMRQINLKEQMTDGANAITLQYEGDGSLLYQVVGRCYVPWEQTRAPQPASEPLALRVTYDKTHLAQDDTATVTVTIHNNTDRTAEMPLIDIGVPPGFTPNPEKLDDAVKAQTISKYTVAARQIIVYMEKLAPNQTVTLTYQVKAKYPIKARTPLSKAYPYYNPEKAAVSAPQDIVVQK